MYRNPGKFILKPKRQKQENKKTERQGITFECVKELREKELSELKGLKDRIDIKLLVENLKLKNILEK